MSNVYYKIYYHIIWGTKNRLDLIDSSINIILNNSIRKKAKELKGELISFNSYIDHCHSLLIIPPKISISNFIGQLKGFSAHEVNKIKGSESIKWQRGFGVLSLSKKGIAFVKNYIQNQQKHHKNNRLIDILEIIPSTELEENQPKGKPLG